MQWLLKTSNGWSKCIKAFCNLVTKSQRSMFRVLGTHFLTFNCDLANALKYGCKTERLFHPIFWKKREGSRFELNWVWNSSSFGLLFYTLLCALFFYGSCISLLSPWHGLIEKAIKFFTKLWITFFTYSKAKMASRIKLSLVDRGSATHLAHYFLFWTPPHAVQLLSPFFKAPDICRVFLQYCSMLIFQKERI